jgi:hypothetical protein
VAIIHKKYLANFGYFQTKEFPPKKKYRGEWHVRMTLDQGFFFLKANFRHLATKKKRD